MARLRSRGRTKIGPIDERPKCSGAVGIVPSLVARRQAASAFDSRKAQAASGSQPNAARKRADRRGLDSVLYTRSPYVFPMGDFKELKAWQYARKLAVLSKDTIARLPESERDALADQWRRAAYSVALNIAEGASRRGVKDFRKHLDIARASLHEVEAILDLVLALEYFRPEELDRKSTRLNSSHGYISYAVFCLKKKKPVLGRARQVPCARRC